MVSDLRLSVGSYQKIIFPHIFSFPSLHVRPILQSTDRSTDEAVFHSILLALSAVVKCSAGHLLPPEGYYKVTIKRKSPTNVPID